MIASLALLAALATPAPQALAAIAVDAPKATLKLQVAQSEEQRELGLMSVTKLAPHTGMVFVFENDQPVEFWMKDTLVPLDMIFVAADGTVRSVAANVPVVPLDTPDEKIPRRRGVGKFVLELPAGEARKDGIVAGTRLRIALPTPAPSAEATAAETPVSYNDGPFRCTPAISGDPGSAAPAPAQTYSSEERNAQSDLDFAGNFHADFGLAATLTLPRVEENKGLFYSNWLLLKALHGNDAFVQLELMRWSKYAYRNEIALTWALPDGVLVYRDTGLFVNDDPHRLAISVSGADVSFAVDGRPLCTAPAAVFFRKADRLYFQVGTEVQRPGDRPAGTVAKLQMKQDGGDWKTPHAGCIYHGYGLSWRPSGDGSFTATGTFDRAKPYLRFTGLNESTPCTL